MHRGQVMAQLAPCSRLEPTALPQDSQRIQETWFQNRLLTWAARSSVVISGGQLREYEQLAKGRFLDPLLVFLLRSVRTPGPGDWARLKTELDRKDAPIKTAVLSAPAELPDLPSLLLVGSDPYLHLAWVCEHLQARSEYSAAEMSDVLSFFKEAADFIALAGSPAERLVFDSIQVVAAGKDTELPDAFVSMSSKRAIGLTGVANLFTSPCTPIQLAGSLIHEAIHSLFYRLELEHPFYTDSAGALSNRITSPWSKRSLELHSFVHATFVWSAMFHFYLRLKEAGVPCQDLLQGCWRGFAEYDHEPLATAPVAQVIQQDVRDAMIACVEHVRETGKQMEWQ